MPAPQDMLDAEQMRALAISLLYTQQAAAPVSFAEWHSAMSLHFRQRDRQLLANQILHDLIDNGSVRHERGRVRVA